MWSKSKEKMRTKTVPEMEGRGSDTALLGKTWNCQMTLTRVITLCNRGLDKSLLMTARIF